MAISKTGGKFVPAESHLDLHSEEENWPRTFLPADADVLCLKSEVHWPVLVWGARTFLGTVSALRWPQQLEGASEDEIKALGQWRSREYKGYVRSSTGADGSLAGKLVRAMEKAALDK